MRKPKEDETPHLGEHLTENFQESFLISSFEPRCDELISLGKFLILKRELAVHHRF